MLTKEIKLPENYKKFFKTENDITTLIEEYIEKEQDKKTKINIEKSEKISFLDMELKNILGIS